MGAARRDGRLVLGAGSAGLLQSRPGSPLLLRGRNDGIFALLAEYMHLVQADPCLERNLREGDGGPGSARRDPQQASVTGEPDRPADGELTPGLTLVLGEPQARACGRVFLKRARAASAWGLTDLRGGSGQARALLAQRYDQAQPSPQPPAMTSQGTAHGQPSRKIRAREAGLWGYLSRPR